MTPRAPHCQALALEGGPCGSWGIGQLDAGRDLSSLPPCLGGGWGQGVSLTALPWHWDSWIETCPKTQRVTGTPPQHGLAGERELSRAGAEEKGLGMLMDEKSGMSKLPAAKELAHAEERLDFKGSWTEKSSDYTWHNLCENVIGFPYRPAAVAFGLSAFDVQPETGQLPQLDMQQRRQINIKVLHLWLCAYKSLLTHWHSRRPYRGSTQSSQSM